VTTLGERLDEIRVRVQVPGTEVSGEVSHRSDVQIQFGRGVYAWASDRTMEGTLTSLAKLLYAGWVRAYRAALPESFRDSLDGADTQADRDFLAARSHLVAVGRSADGRVTVQVRGLREVTVRVADGTVQALDESEFAERVTEAAADLLRDQSAKIDELKQRYYE
jgi:hypothetical protein